MKLKNSRSLFRLISQIIGHILLIATGFIYIYPFLWMVSGSFKTSEEFFSSAMKLLPQNFIWTNYTRAWSEARFGIYFGNTIFISLGATLLVILITSMAGYAFARIPFPGKRVLVAIILITIFLPSGYTIIPIFEVIKKIRLINTLWAVIIVNAAGGLAFNTFLFTAYFTTFPKELEEVAMMNGASIPVIYRKIALPLAKPMIGAVALFEFLGNWNSFFVPLVFTLGRTDLRTISVGLYVFVGQHSVNWPLMCAGASISILPTIFLFFFLHKLFIKGVAGAIKG